MGDTDDTGNHNLYDAGVEVDGELRISLGRDEDAVMGGMSLYDNNGGDEMDDEESAMPQYAVPQRKGVALYDSGNAKSSDGPAKKAPLYDSASTSDAANPIIYDNNVGPAKKAPLYDSASTSDSANPIIYDNNVSKRLSTFDETDFNTFVESPPLSPAPVEVKSQGGTRRTLSEDDLGKRVIVLNYGEGVLKFFGLNKEDGAARCGVALDNPAGSHNGTVNVSHFILST